MSDPRFVRGPLGFCRVLALSVPLLIASRGAAQARYLDVETLASTLEALTHQDAWPAELLTIGQSLNGQPIKALVAGLPGETPLRERPRLVIVSGLRGDQRLGTAIAAALPSALLSQAQSDTNLHALLSRWSIEVIPCVNPDGLAAVLEGPRRAFRWNLRPVDRDRDGQVDEDGPGDLNGDGVVSELRVQDPEGEWRVSDEDPRLMVRADRAKGERGGWKVLIEGMDADDDGDHAEDGPGGVDLARNFAHGWKEHDPDTGTSSPSEPESRALIDHFLSTRAIAAVLVLGDHDTLVKVPPHDTAEPRMPPKGPLKEDMPWWEAIAKSYRDLTGAKEPRAEASGGTFHEWAYFQFGIPAFAAQVFHPRNPEDATLPSGKKPESEEARWLCWSDRMLGGSGYLPWSAFDHPDLGTVEIGGADPLARSMPPEGHLPELLDQQTRFVADLLSRLPHLRWARTRVERLGPSVHAVHATLVNDGYLPLVTAMAVRARAVAPARVIIDAGGDAEVLHGEPMIRLDGLPGLGGARTFRWVVRGDGAGVTLRAWSEKGGSAVLLVELKDGG